MSFTDTFETRVLTFVFTGSSVTRPTAWFLSLHSGASSDSSAGTELSGNAYARQAVAFSVSGNLATNSGAIEWPVATGSWGTVTDISVFDASSGGNMSAYATLRGSKAIATGDVFRIPAGDLAVTRA